jgi:hypothetical protein
MTVAAVNDLLPDQPPKFGDIPWGYGENRITAMARDPHWLFAYWEITDEGISAARSKIGDSGAGFALRVYDTTHRLFDGLNPNSYFDVGVDRGTNQYYLRVGRPAAVFHLDIGVRSADGAFAPIARSGPVEMPRDSVSSNTRTEWSTILRSGGGYGYRHRYAPKPGVPSAAPALADAGGAAPLEEVFQSLTEEGWTRSEWVETLMEGRAVRWIRWTGPFLPDWFPLVPAGTYRHVEVLFQGERRVVRIGEGERFVYGPWRMVLEAVGPRGERRTIHQWMLRHRWTTEEGSARIETPAILTRILGGTRVVMEQSGSELRMRREAWGSESLQGGASEWRWVGASEIHLGGASETLFGGATETLFIGASERVVLGGSEGLWKQGSSELYGGGSEEVRP